MTRLTRAVALISFVATAWATPLGGHALERACAAGNLHIAVVVDPGNSSAVSAVCVPAAERENGAVLLAARARLLGTPEPRYAPSGLLCAIDGVPSTGCGEPQDGHFAYWSYWHGTNGTWTYSSIGPATWRVDPGTVEGWRWQPAGSASPSDPPPRGPVNPTATCPLPPPATTKPPTTTAAPAQPGQPTVGPTSVTVASAAGTQPPPNQPSSTGPHTTAASADTLRTGPDATTATTTRGHLSTTRPRLAPSTSVSTVALTKGGIAAVSNTDTSGGSGGAPVGLVVGVLLVIGLGVGGAVATRRRRPAS